MVWKVVPVDNPGNSNVFGGNDQNKISKYFSGYDLKIDDPSDGISIATDTVYTSEKFRILSPNTGFQYIFRTQDITADRFISLPLMEDDAEISLSATSAVNDWGAFMQTFRNQNIRIMNPGNTFGYVFNTGAILANRNVMFPLLTTDDTFVFTNATQTLSNKTLSAPSITSMIVNTDANTIKHSTNNNNGDLLVNTGTKYDRFARGGPDQVPIMNSTGTALSWIDKVALTGTGGGGGGEVTGDYLVPDVNNVITGVWYGTPAPGSGSGVWSGFMNDTSTVAGQDLIADTVGRMGTRYDFSSDDDRGGFSTKSTHFTRLNNPELVVRYRYFPLSAAHDSGTSYRVVIGFTDDPTADYGSDGQLDGRSAFMWWKETGDSSIQVGRNNGAGSGVKESAVSLTQTNSSLHTIRLFGDSANNRFGISLDGANATYYTTEIPASTTRLGSIVQFENEGSDARSFELYSAYFRAKVL